MPNENQTVQTEAKPDDKQKETLLKILAIQNEGIESCIENVNKYLGEIYAHNRSLMFILRQDLR